MNYIRNFIKERCIQCICLQKYKQKKRRSTVCKNCKYVDCIAHYFSQLSTGNKRPYKVTQGHKDPVRLYKVIQVEVTLLMT